MKNNNLTKTLVIASLLAPAVAWTAVAWTAVNDSTLSASTTESSSATNTPTEAYLRGSAYKKMQRIAKRELAREHQETATETNPIEITEKNPIHRSRSRRHRSQQEKMVAVEKDLKNETNSPEMSTPLTIDSLAVITTQSKEINEKNTAIELRIDEFEQKIIKMNNLLTDLESHKLTDKAQALAKISDDSRHKTTNIDYQSIMEIIAGGAIVFAGFEWIRKRKKSNKEKSTIPTLLQNTTETINKQPIDDAMNSVLADADRYMYRGEHMNAESLLCQAIKIQPSCNEYSVKLNTIRSVIADKEKEDRVITLLTSNRTDEPTNIANTRNTKSTSTENYNAIASSAIDSYAPKIKDTNEEIYTQPIKTNQKIEYDFDFSEPKSPP